MSEVIASENRMKISWGPRETTIPQEWGFDEIEEHAQQIIYPQRDKPTRFDGDIPWIRIEDLDGKYVSDSTEDRYVSEELIDEMNLRTFPKNTVMCSCSGDMGVCAITERRLLSNQTFAGIVTEESIENEYLYYTLENLDDDLQRMSTGTTIPYLSSDKLREFPIPVPPLPEQRRIAAVLSTVDEEIRKTEEIIETTEELRVGLRQELFHEGYFDHETTEKGTIGETPAGWDIERLDEVADVTMGTSPKSEYYNEDGDGLPFFQANNEFGYRNPTHDRWCSNPKKTAEDGDVLVTMRGTYVGQVNIATEECCIGRGLAAVSAKEVDQEYLFHQLDQREAYVKSIASGSTFDSINSSELRSLLVQVPPEEEQKKIANTLRSLQMKYMAEQEKKQKLQELKRALMQDLLTGDVRVSNLKTAVSSGE